MNYTEVKKVLRTIRSTENGGQHRVAMNLIQNLKKTHNLNTREINNLYIKWLEKSILLNKKLLFDM